MRDEQINRPSSLSDSKSLDALSLTAASLASFYTAAAAAASETVVSRQTLFNFHVMFYDPM